MADLIDRQAALDNIKSYFGDLMIQGRNDILLIIKNIPSAEPQRKKGKWIVLPPTDPWIYACDQCGRLSDDDENYCPDCGAEMKGVK